MVGDFIDRREALRWGFQLADVKRVGPRDILADPAWTRLVSWRTTCLHNRSRNSCGGWRNVGSRSPRLASVRELVGATRAQPPGDGRTEWTESRFGC